MTPVDDLAKSLDATEPLVASVRDEQWTAPTPCTEWNVRELLGHLVSGNVVFTRLMRGEAATPEQARPADPLGDDPAAAYRASTQEMIAAFRQPGATEQTITMAMGTLPGSVAVQIRLVETLAHGWDLARATGQTASYPEDLVEQVLTFTRDRLSQMPPGMNPFGPAQPVADDAPALDRLVAALGRSVD